MIKFIVNFEIQYSIEFLISSHFYEGRLDISGKMRDPFITLEEASRSTPYDANYLGLLVRQKKLSAKKVKGRWMTTRSEVENYLSNHSRVALFAPASKRNAMFFALLFLLVAVFSLLFPTMFFWHSESANNSASAAIGNPFEKVASTPKEVTVVSTDGQSLTSTMATGSSLNQSKTP